MVSSANAEDYYFLVPKIKLVFILKGWDLKGYTIKSDTPALAVFY